MQKLKVVILGFGNRGSQYYNVLMKKKSVEVVNIVDNAVFAQNLAKNFFLYPNDKIISSTEEFFSKKKCADAVIISTQDKEHFYHTISAIKKGYCVLLEKPIATTLKETLKMSKLAKKYKSKIMVCHVLRYSKFYQTINSIVNQGKIGKIVSVNMTENVAYWRTAHSYVRGPWANSKKSSPMILAKCSHDLDILRMITKQKVLRLSSYGELAYFTKSKAPLKSTEYCTNCLAKSECLYNAFEIYKAHPNYILGNRFSEINDQNDIYRLIKDNKSLSKCVFRCENNVVDRQIVNLQLTGGVIAQLSLNPLSSNDERTIRIHGEKGEIFAIYSQKKIILKQFGKAETIYDLQVEEIEMNMHCGGDEKLIDDFISFALNDKVESNATTLEESLESHIMAFASEKSKNKKGKNIRIRRRLFQ